MTPKRTTSRGSASPTTRSPSSSRPRPARRRRSRWAGRARRCTCSSGARRGSATWRAKPGGGRTSPGAGGEGVSRATGVGVGLVAAWRLLSLGFTAPDEETLAEIEALGEALLERAEGGDDPTAPALVGLLP